MQQIDASLSIDKTRPTEEFSAKTSKAQPYSAAVRTERFARSKTQKLSPFQVIGVVGILTAFLLSVLLATHLSLSVAGVFLLLAVSLLCFLLVACLTRFLNGVERIVYYWQVLVIFGCNAAIFRLLGVPFASYSDILALGIGLFLFFGRIGCFFVGCCHGRPSRWGRVYRGPLVRRGFPLVLSGVPLFPVQALESLWVFAVVTTGTVWLWRHAAPGLICAFYFAAYGFGRFFLEFLRGDNARPYFAGFSEAQWISLVLAGWVAVAEKVNFLPASRILSLPFLILLPVVLLITLLRLSQRGLAYKLFSSAHLNEMASAIAFLREKNACADHGGFTISQPFLHVAQTSVGMSISMGRVRRLSGTILHFSVTWSQRRLTKRETRMLARLLRDLCGVRENPQIVETAAGACHFLWPEGSLSN